jgi:ATP-binding cassette subfamily F protein uup
MEYIRRATMNILSLQNIRKAWSEKLLFDNLSFGLDEGDRLGVIGINGTGKSTLLKIMTGIEPPDSGSRATRQGLRIEYLAQTPEYPAGRSVLDYLFDSNSEQSSLVHNYEMLSLEYEKNPGNPEIGTRYDQILRRMDAADAWEYEIRARVILNKLGISDMDADASTLSGGEQRRLAVARVLITEPDLFVLDEPTNHLDAETVDWLEDYLNHRRCTVVMVTHDRYFLDRVTNRMLELDRGVGRFFSGNYSHYCIEKVRLEDESARAESRSRNVLRQELTWLQRGAKARSTKQKARIERIDILQSQEVYGEKQSIEFVSGTRRLGRKVLKLDGVSRSIGGGTLIKDFSYTFGPHDRLGITGPNGCGKTTLVNMMTGRLEPDIGGITTGKNVFFGYYDQVAAGFNVQERAIHFVKREGGEMLESPDGRVMTAELMLERFMFTRTMLSAPVGKLSGGERRRLYLVCTLMRDPNFLILDEPTNDLDIDTLRALENYLDGFRGCLIVISHDRYFLDRTVDHLLVFEGAGVIGKYPGPWDTCSRILRENRSGQTGEMDEAAMTAAWKKQQDLEALRQNRREERRRERLSYMEQREFDALDEKIIGFEQRLAVLEQEMLESANDHQQLRKLDAEQINLRIELKEANDRWSDLAERAD